MKTLLSPAVALCLSVLSVSGADDPTWRESSFDSSHTIICYGDSLTYGRNATTVTVSSRANFFDGRLNGQSVQASYPYYLSARVPSTFNVIAQARTGMYTDLILAWQGGRTIKTSAAITVPVSGSVKVSNKLLFDGTGNGDICVVPSQTNRYCGLVAPYYSLHEKSSETGNGNIKKSITGRFGDVQVRITGDESTNLLIRARTTLSQPAVIPQGTAFVPDSAYRSPYKDAIQVIFAGTNDRVGNYQRTINQIAEAVAKIPSGRYIVISSHTNLFTGAETILQPGATVVEQAFASAFGAHHLNLRLALKAKNAGWQSLLADGLHFGNAGYDLVSEIVYEKLEALGYLSGVPPSSSVKKGFERAAEENRPPRVLVIGNSFTQGVSRDVQYKNGQVKETRTHFPTAVRAMNEKIDYCALYRGGSSIQQHYEARNVEGFYAEVDWSFEETSAAPAWAPNGEKKGMLWLDEDSTTQNNANSDTLKPGSVVERNTTPADWSLAEILESVDWDVVMIQEASVVAPFLNKPSSEWTGVHATEPFRDYGTGIPRESYGTPLQNYIAFIRQKAPHAELWWHQTWALPPDTTKIDLGSERKRDWMYNAIATNSQWVADTYDVKIMPVGYAVQLYRYQLPVSYPDTLMQDPCSFDKRHINGGYYVYGSNEIPEDQRYRTYLQMMTWCYRFYGKMPAPGATAYEPTDANGRFVMRSCALQAGLMEEYWDYGQETDDPPVVTRPVYYFVGSDPTGESSFSKSYSSSIGWAQIYGGTVIASHVVSADNDYVITGNAVVMRTPKTDGAITFAGHSLTLAANGGITVKGAHVPMTFNSLIINGGAIVYGDKGKDLTINGPIEIVDDTTFGFTMLRPDGTVDTTTVLSQIAGGGTLRLKASADSAATKVQTLVLSDASSFTGKVNAVSYSNSKKFVLKVTNGFGGSVESLPFGTEKVVFNYTGLDSAKGVVVSPTATAVPDGFASGLVLFGIADTSAANLPLITLPTNITVSVSDFTVSYAASVDAAATAFANLGFRVNGDGTKTLVANAATIAPPEIGGTGGTVFNLTDSSLDIRIRNADTSLLYGYKWSETLQGLESALPVELPHQPAANGEALLSLPRYDFHSGFYRIVILGH